MMGAEWFMAISICVLGVVLTALMSLSGILLMGLREGQRDLWSAIKEIGVLIGDWTNRVVLLEGQHAAKEARLTDYEKRLGMIEKHCWEEHDQKGMPHMPPMR